MGYVFCLIFQDFTLITTLNKSILIGCWVPVASAYIALCFDLIRETNVPIVSKLQLPIRLSAHSCVRSSVWLSIKQIKILGMHHPSRVVILETVYLHSSRSWWSFCLSISNWQNTSITGCLWATSTVTKPRYATKARKKIKKGCQGSHRLCSS